MPNRDLARARPQGRFRPEVRVGSTSPPATAGPEEWPSPEDGDRIRLTGPPRTPHLAKRNRLGAEGTVARGTGKSQATNAPRRLTKRGLLVRHPKRAGCYINAYGTGTRPMCNTRRGEPPRRAGGRGADPQLSILGLSAIWSRWLMRMNLRPRSAGLTRSVEPKRQTSTLLGVLVRCRPKPRQRNHFRQVQPPNQPARRCSI